MWSLYYQAQVSEPESWFMVGILRSFEHLCFDRTLDVKNSIFEFFVPAENEKTFLELMHWFEQQGIVRDVKKLENRLKDPAEVF
jgi:hypothetical protein